MIDNTTDTLTLETGDTVRIRENVPKKYARRKFGYICSKTIIEDNETANKLSEPLGTIVYLVESSDGYLTEIPEQYLEKH